MKAIVVAAGMGRRLSPYTEQMPKCLVPVGDRSILQWQLEAFREHGIDDIVIIRGYLAEVLEQRHQELGPGVRFVTNDEYQTNNILQSLFCAEQSITGDLLISYSDIIYTHDVVRRAVESAGDIALIIDRDFANIYEGRTDHPLQEAEVSDLFPNGHVKRVGKRALPAAEAWGEFIGLMKLSATGASWVRQAWDELQESYRGRSEEPFQRANTFRNAYLTDLLQHLIDSGRPVTPVEIRGCWREIDTVQDLHRARALLRSSQENWK